ncbi:MAG: hypothetical protein ACYCS7_00935 [Acidimicrobiales bacterium]
MCRRCGCLNPGRTAPPRAAPVEGMLEAVVLLACAEGPRYGYELGPWLAEEGLVPGTVSPGRPYETLASLARLLARGIERSYPPHGHWEGGEAMSCHCHCGGSGAQPIEAAPQVPAPERSIEDRLQVIEDLLQQLSPR